MRREVRWRHLVEPVACTPASGWEKGQVENQVELVLERFFTPRLRFKSYDELNAWLMDKCIAWAQAHGHPERPDHDLGGVREGAAEAHSLSRPLRRVPCAWVPGTRGYLREIRTSDLFGAGVDAALTAPPLPSWRALPKASCRIQPRLALLPFPDGRPAPGRFLPSRPEPLDRLWPPRSVV